MKDYGSEVIKRLLKPDNPEDFFGFIIKDDGIWLPRSTDERYRDDVRTVEYDFVNGELVEKEQEPYPFEGHDPSKPVLKLPCSQGELRDFLVRSGLDSMVMPDHKIFRKDDFSTPEAVVKKLKEEGKGNKEIVSKLRSISPEMTAAKISRLIYSNDQMTTPKARAKRVERMLKEIEKKE